MIRGTTPTHIFLLPEDLDPGSFSEMYITYAQLGSVVTEKERNDMTIIGHEVRVTLSQEETLRLLPGTVEIQMRVKTVSGSVFASGIVETTVDKVLKGGVI